MKHKCGEYVRSDYPDRPPHHDCGNDAFIEHNNIWYCPLHDPPAVHERVVKQREELLKALKVAASKLQEAGLRLPNLHLILARELSAAGDAARDAIAKVDSNG